MSTDVLIVGGGPVGLTLASDLARWGVPFRVLDKKPGPEEHSKAASFWPRTQEAAAAMGWLERVRAEGVPLRATAVRAFGRRVGEVPLGPYPSPHPAVLDVNQGRIEHALSEHLAEAGHRVEYGAAVVAINQDRGGGFVEAEVDSGDGRGETLRASYLVGCDGAGSVVRDLAGLGIEGYVRLPNSALWQVDARLAWGRPTTPDRIWFFMLDDGMCMVAPLPGGHHRVTVLGGNLLAPDRDPALKEMEGALRKVAEDPLVELFEPVWSSHGRLGYGLAPSFRNGRVFLAGDAGHVTIPIGGQGMNTGMQDAFNLGWKLAYVLQGRAAPALLDSYDPERRAVRRELAEDQAKNFYRLTRPSVLQRFAMRRLGPLLVRLGASVELGRRDESQLGIGYRGGPLSEDRPAGREGALAGRIGERLGKGGLLRSGVLAGDRAPDAAVVEAAPSRDTTLFDLIYSGGWTLLAFDDADGGEAGDRLRAAARRIGRAFPDVRARPVLADPGAPGRAPWGDGPVLLDLDRLAHEAYRVKRPSFFLIRPDGHVAFRGGVDDEGLLRAYCDRLLTDARGIAQNGGGPAAPPGYEASRFDPRPPARTRG